MFRNRNRRYRDQLNRTRQQRRRRLAGWMIRSPRIEMLEDRRVLAVFNPLAAAVDGAVGSLRDAVLTANFNGESDTIQLEAGTYQLTIANDAVLGQETSDGSQGDLDLIETGFQITFQGQGVGVTVIQQAVLDRVFQVLPGVTAIFNDLSIVNGTAVDDGTDGAPPNVGDGNGGGILNHGTLDLAGVELNNNQALGADPGEGGGGLFNTAVATINDSTVVGNRADAALGNGGGILNSTAATLTLNNSVVQSNHANRAGGGIENNNGDVFLLGTSLIQNEAGINGGGLHVSGPGFTRIDGGSFSDNIAGQEGGGLWNGTDEMIIDGATIENNVANGNGSDQGGGGVFNAGGSVSIGSATRIADNRAPGGSGSGGGIFNDVGGFIEVIDSTVTGNTASRAGGGIEDNSGSGLGIDLVNVNLTDNITNGLGNGPGNGGGLHITGPGDVNITGGSVVGNTAALEGGGLWNGSGTMTISGTRIETNVASGNAPDDGGGGIFNNAGDLVIVNSQIGFNEADGVAGSGGGILSLAGNVEIDSSEIALNSANRAGGGIEIVAGVMDLFEVNLINNDVAGLGLTATAPNPGNGGGLHVSGAAQVTLIGGLVFGNQAAAEGGGLWNSSTGTMVVDGTIIDSNIASGNLSNQGGGGVFNAGGDLILRGVAIVNNIADGTLGSGGGVLNEAGGTVQITQSDLLNNTATRAGGGLEDNAGSSVSIVESTIDGNDAGTAPGNGGGVHITGPGSVTVDRSTISNNTAIEGGGLWNSGGGNFTITNSTISSNTATGSDGGGIFNTSGGTITIDSATITLNQASTGNGSGIAGGTSGVTIENTIVAQNPGGGSEQNLSGSIASNDFNLIGDSDDGTLTGATINTIFGANALLLPLADNGGPTQTHLPGAGSPAISNGNTTLMIDQRGVSRPQGGDDDIGAVEVSLNNVIVSADADGLPDEFRIINDTNGPTGDVQLFINSQLITFPKATTGLIIIRGSADDDTLTIDNSNGLIGSRIVFDADGVGGGEEVLKPGGFDTLQLIGSTTTNTTYNPGETADAGAVFQENSQVTQRVEFFGLEPVQIRGSGPGSTLNVGAAVLGAGFPQALQANNVISYRQGPNSNDPLDPIFAGDTTGLITVDGFESLEFSGFETLSIDAGAGDDVIDLNNPLQPTDLTAINASGGDSSVVDTVTLNGTTAADTLAFNSMGFDSAAVTGAGPVPISLSQVSAVILNGQGGGDNLIVTPTLASETTLTPGTAPDAASLTIRGLTSGPGTGAAALGLEYLNLGSGNAAAAAGSFTLQGAVPGVRSEILVVRGTDTFDLFNVENTATDDGVVQLLKTREGLQVIGTIEIFTPGVTALGLAGLGGSDFFDIEAPHPFNTQLIIDGGDGDDVVFIDGTDGSDQNYVVDTGGLVDGARISETVSGRTFGIGNVVSIGFLGEAGDQDTVTVLDTTGDDDITLQPGFARAGSESDVIRSASFDLDIELFGPFTNVTIDTSGAGNDTLEIHPTGLTSASRYTAVASAGRSDQLRLVGTAGVDTVTSDADTVTFNSVPVEFTAGQLAQIEIHTLGGDDNVTLTALAEPKTIDVGDGNDIVDLSAAVDATIIGGDGDDTITGSPADDRIFGGSGDDTILALGGDDFIDGGDGNDTVTGGRGSDRFNGGDGSDTFIWNQGDGSDRIEGDGGGVDVVVFNGATGAQAATENFTLSANAAVSTSTAARLLLNRSQGGVNLDIAGVEQVDINGDSGVETFVVGDLSATELAVLNLDLGAAGDTETVTVNGRVLPDQLQVALAAGIVSVSGLRYETNIAGAAGDTDDDSLIVNGNAGDDHLTINDAVEGTIDVTLDGGAGDDTLIAGLGHSSSDTVLSGGPGNDDLRGGSGDDTINGDAGQDNIRGGDGDDTIDGGDDFDTIEIVGTPGDDFVDVFQTSPTAISHTVNGDSQVDTLIAGSIQQARIIAGDGGDLIRVNWNDGLATTATIDAVRMTVDGGDDTTSDRLVVVDDGTDDLVLYRKSAVATAGTVQIGPGLAEPLLGVFNGIERVDFVDEAGVAISGAAGGPRLVVFKHDSAESNDNRLTATYLGSGSTINVDPTIDPGPLSDPFGDGQDLTGDSDFYRVVAETTGTLDFQVYFRQIGTLASGRAGLPGDGNLDINVYDAAGNLISGFGTNDTTDDERVRIPAVAGQSYFLQVLGGASGAINTYDITVVNQAPPVPYGLELLDNPPDGTTNPPGTSVNSDTGRSQFDNHTYDTMPTLYFRLDDGIFLNDLPGNPATASPPDQIIPIPLRVGPAQPTTAGFAIAIFDEGNTLPQTAGAAQTPLGFATAVAGQPGIYQFTVPTASALSAGSHFLSARVQMIDPATARQTGFGPRSELLEIVVDVTPPAVTVGLSPDSDSGDAALPTSFVDRITNDSTPTLFGRAEANSIVRAYVDANSNGLFDLASDVLIGQSVATPIDGTNQAPDGQWQITSTVNLNDPNLLGGLGVDGARRIFVTAEDLAGNISTPAAASTLQIFLDTSGPQVTDVRITGQLTFDLFSLKPTAPQPTPAVDGLTISIRDLPSRISGFLSGALSNAPSGLLGSAQLASVVLVGDHSGAIPITNAVFNPGPLVPGIATGQLVLSFTKPGPDGVLGTTDDIANPLPDDRYTLTLRDNLIDPAGNRLDGESNAAEPTGTPAFPSGDGISGGDFVARFTVDSRPEVATWAQGVVYVDINGNFVWDPEGQDNDAVNRDFAYNFGELSDAYFAGNFAATDATAASGFDKIGAYGAFNGQFQFFLDTDDDGVGDFVGAMAFQVNASPVAGDFNADHPGDEIGAYDGQNWYLDINGNNRIDASERFTTSLRGIPVVGDFNGDGNDDLATYNNDTGLFQFDLDRNGTVDDTLTFGFGGFGEIPVAGDINLDGIDDIVMWVPKQQGQLPKDSGEFHFLVSDRILGTLPPPGTPPMLNYKPSAIFDPFSPAPLGNDLISQFGDDFALPIFGNFDPPVAVDGGTGTVPGSLTNIDQPLDTNLDGKVTARDALVVINALGRGDFNQTGSPLRVVASLNGFKLDATQDGRISALDALRVINHLGRINPISGVEAPAAEQLAATSLTDQAITDLDDEDNLLRILALDQEQQRDKTH